ncbi:heat shock protein 90-1-like [Pyrus ussuriensis x Pyrus communis]|uniref:Heat shock protein 90-1-like n=1 Tax=Pyrus ussuriensis x Pyrus communis TaxID=2448454 RepID=A0A5N5GJM3_9ROSA|nr:heat shock protein 90-1-like [Pyrus ussuriensis x Pyrus communis]
MIGPNSSANPSTHTQSYQNTPFISRSFPNPSPTLSETPTKTLTPLSNLQPSLTHPQSSLFLSLSLGLHLSISTNMHRLPRRSVSAILRHGSARYRNSAAPISCASTHCGSVGETDRQVRWHSVLVPGKCNTTNSATFNLKNGLYFGNRYESTAAASDASAAPPAETYEYQAEVSRLMDLIVNSLYSNKEVFLRELISNASDALDKLRFLSVTQPELLKGGGDLDIHIQTDKDNGIIHIIDSGIGMTRQELIDCLGTIAQSGTSKFLKALKDSKDAGSDTNLIGQFGVGFYSAFLVADRIVVSTKSPKSDKQYVWQGEVNASSYTIQEETDPEKLIPRGTRITLYLKRDDKGFAHPERIEKLVKNYSQFVSFPIYTWKEKGFTKEVEVDEDPAESKTDEQDEKTEKKKKTKTVVEKYWDWDLTNETQPIWLRNPKEVNTEDYNEFYKKTFNEYLDPLASSHFTTEGEVEFRSILYVPAVPPMGKDDIVNPKTKNIRLYVKRVFISDDFDGELFPRYLSFVKGVVDSNDLPLNVSREILQESRIVRIMRKRLVRKAFDMILGISMSENREDYEKFWENFGKHLKLGCIEDRENHKRIAPLLRFFSSQSEDVMISLDEYLENMKPEQKDIYYIASDSVTSARNTPFLEKLLEKDFEVLYLVDPIDEVAIQNLKSYKEKNFIDISKEDLDLGDRNEEKEKEIKQEYSQTCDWIKKRLGDKVASVQISNRLSSSPCVLVSGKFGWSANMERLMKAQTVGDTSSLEYMRGRRVFEINPEHPIIKNLNAASKTNPDDEDAIRAIDLLYNTALVSSGFTPENPAELGGKIYEMMSLALSGKWSTPAAEIQQPELQQHNPDILDAEVQHPGPQHNHPETLEAEVVEPVESGSQK